MRGFTNENVKKVKKSNFRLLVVAVVLLIAAVSMFVWHGKVVEDANKNIKDLHTIILSDGEKEEQKSYIMNAVEPYKFAEYDDEPTSGYYLVADETYMYVIYMDYNTYSSINLETIYDIPVRLEGVTKYVTKDVKELAIEAYNEGLEEEEQLSLADYEVYFGDVYLDVTEDAESSIGGFQSAMGILIGIFGIIMLILALNNIISFSKGIKKLSDNEISIINGEINDPAAFYYSDSRLFLTKNYIFALNGKVKIIKYSDLIWAYPKEFSYRGVRTGSVMVYDKDGNNYEIGQMNINTKKSKEIHNEIFQTIISKNDKMTVGFTKENQIKMNQEIKEIKQRRKETK